MGDKTKIGWTDASWNPLRGCSRVSKGCEHCYAESVAHRFNGDGLAYEGLTTNGRWNGKIKYIEHVLDQPLRWRKPRRIFVNSMSDLFHKNVPDEYIDKVFAVMAIAQRHTFQVLTKRPKRMQAYCASNDTLARIMECVAFALEDGGSKAIVEWVDDGFQGVRLHNVHLGVSISNQADADRFIPDLLATPAAVRFVSAEPLLGSIDFGDALPAVCPECEELNGCTPSSYGNCECWCHMVEDERTTLDWVIVGGESGPKARPCEIGWIRSIKDQCQAAGTPVFVKQLGRDPLTGEAELDGQRLHLHLEHRAGADPAEWAEDLRVQEFPG